MGKSSVKVIFKQGNFYLIKIVQLFTFI